MHDALSLLADLRPATAGWILANGVQRTVPAETELVRQGDETSDLTIILDGVCAVRLKEQDNVEIAILGPGELVGEISFLERSQASASVVALEESRVLSLARATLEQQISADASFGVDIYRALGRLAARRLRARTSFARADVRVDAKIDALPELTALRVQLDSFKEALRLADAKTAHGATNLPAEIAARLEREFNGLVDSLADTMSRISAAELRKRVAASVQRELNPYIYLTKLAQRFFAKPRGYAGDFLSIEGMYTNDIGGIPPLGPVLDDLFNKRPAAQAVRNRRGLLKEEILRARDEHAPCRIASLACGPAREVFDVFSEAPDANIVATLVDIDFQALAFVAERRDKAGLRKKIHLEHANLIYLATGRETTGMTDQHLIYSIGLIDYLEDKLVIQLLNWIHGRLAVGGRVILGNFHPSNRDRALMDVVLDWKLIHRSEEDMNRLFAASVFGRPCTELRFEAAHVNLFASCVKT